ncbi:MAG: RHH-type transcriptional regulator, proline utilization regulon repressor / proline dehydrogenase [Solirubrobacteraceae bacterium]|nr:RHH-type transcriptional regulator, proline utilization regulon repressor / proline dehydrogenase [Solirubrobacteraceae bacterium]
MTVPLPPFANEPVLELRRAPVRAQLADALATVDARLPLRVPVWVGTDRGAVEGLDSTDPGAPDRVVAATGSGGASDVQAAVDAATRGAREWGARPAAERAATLVAAAGLLRERRIELAALEVRECAKPWPEADADVCEAIDFLEYYARDAVELERGPALLQAPGERNELRYVPRGVAAVISPWNFPLAIPAGMTAAALATGNAVVLKPAEQSPGCALELVTALREAGVPADAIALLPGEGETGAALVRHPGVHTIAFTGSAAVGLEIVETAAQRAPGQDHLKHVIAEMGGKNCVIVDADADLDEAVPAIVGSAFAYAGQKCSAAARVLAHDAVTARLLERLAGAVELLVTGPADDLGSDVPALIERAAQERVDAYATRAAADGELVARGGEPPARGWYSRPTVVTGLPADSAVLREEVFGPLLTVEAVPDVEAACDVVDGLPFGLTGGLFSRDPRTVEAVVRRSPVGNLYINRGITGAMVGRQPFGGNRLSGTGTKAGGPHYLLEFVEPRAVTENTVRHGLVADL